MASTLLNDLVSYYKLDESSGDAIDSAGSNDGTVNGATQGVTGKINTAYDFDGNDYISCGTQSLANNSFSISVWIAADSTSCNYAVGQGTNSSRRGLHFGRRSSNGKFTFAFFADDLDSSTSVATDGTWEHWVGTYDASTNSRKLYRNGVLDSSDTAGGDYIGTGTLYIARSYTTSYFYGKIDEVGIWDRALTSSEITELYNSGDGISYPFSTGPTTQATNVSFSNIETTSATISWTNGNGDKRAVFMKETDTGTASPVDGTTYSADTGFGDGDEIGTTGWYCVYNGTGSTVDVTKLSDNTTYRVMVTEYNE